MIPGDTTSGPMLGTDAGWALSFHRETETGIANTTIMPDLTSAQYYASIDATLPEGMAPGAYKIVIEQLTDADFAKLRDPERPRGLHLVCKLHLFWRDANTSAGAYLTNLLGVNAGPSPADLHRSLVAVLRVKKMTRRVGTRGYDTELTCVEEAYARLSEPITGEPLTAENFRAALQEIRRRTTVGFAPWEYNPDGTMTHGRGEAGGSESVTFGVGMRYRDAVEAIGNAIQLGRNLYGRKMILIRDGTVHVGKRPIPYPEGPPKELTLGTGLLDCAEAGDEAADPYGGEGGAGPRRKVWNLTLRGRPDLKPGDVVRFEPPPVDEGTTLPSVGVALAGAFAAPFLDSVGGGGGKLLYVRSVRHTHSRQASFATQLSGVEIESTAQAWDTWSDATPTGGPQPASSSGASGAVSAADQVRRVARAARLESRSVEVGEVRGSTTNASGAVEPPAQTLTVWEGLERSDGRPNAARRVPIRREPAVPVNGVPYLTPFAWGGCGLVLPRYPGMRVALAYRNGAGEDPIEIGALWPSGHAPRSEPGDWWLSLPVGVASSKRASVSDTETVGDHTGNVVHDLTDGDGHRVIEVGELTVRVGQLRDRNQRPARAADEGSVTIEHTGGAKLVLKQDGSILIKGKAIELDAGTGDITMKANKVDVQVTSEMEVH